MQPEVSFAMKNISNYTSIMNWKNPKTERDKIRLAFKNKGQEYLLYKESTPMAHDMIKPIREGDEIIKWWNYL